MAIGSVRVFFIFASSRVSVSHKTMVPPRFFSPPNARNGLAPGADLRFWRADEKQRPTTLAAAFATLHSYQTYPRAGQNLTGMFSVI